MRDYGYRLPACKKCNNLHKHAYRNTPYGYVKTLCSSSTGSAKKRANNKNVKIVVVNVMMIYLHYLPI